MWALIVTVFIGFFTGLIARALHPGQDHSGFVFTTLLGITGSWFMAYIGRFFGFYEPGTIPNFLASVVGAIVLLMLYQAIHKRMTLSASHHHKTP